MKWNPVLSAGAAIAYIALIALFLNFIETYRHDTPDTILDGIGFLSLLVFSASVMAFLFFYRPIVLLIENKKAEALSYFLKTLGVFGAITATLITLVSFQ